MPGTMLAGENAACSTSAKTFSGFRLSSKYPTSISGKSTLRPDLGQVEGIEWECLRLRVRHHLDEQGPAREIAGLDVFEQIALMAFAILADEGLGFRVRQILDALLGTEVEFDPDALVCGIEKAVRVAAEAVHVTEALRNASIAHDDRDLVQRFRQQRPEVPVVVGAAHAGARIALDGVIEVGKRSGSRKKNTGVLLPTTSQLPSSV